MSECISNHHDEDIRLESLVSAITENLNTFSCELVRRTRFSQDRDDGERSSFVKVRNCSSNAFKFSSSLFAILKLEMDELRVSIFTYNEEELESELVSCEAEDVCSLLSHRLGLGNYTFCCGVLEKNLMKKDLKMFEMNNSIVEKFGSRVVF